MGNEKREWNKAFLVSQPCSNVTSAQKGRVKRPQMNITFEPSSSCNSGTRVARAPVLRSTYLKTNKVHQWVKRGDREVSPSMVSDMVAFMRWVKIPKNDEGRTRAACVDMRAICTRSWPKSLRERRRRKHEREFLAPGRPDPLRSPRSEYRGDLSTKPSVVFVGLYRNKGSLPEIYPLFRPAMTDLDYTWWRPARGAAIAS